MFFNKLVLYILKLLSLIELSYPNVKYNSLFFMNIKCPQMGDIELANRLHSNYLLEI